MPSFEIIYHRSRNRSPFSKLRGCPLTFMEYRSQLKIGRWKKVKDYNHVLLHSDKCEQSDSFSSAHTLWDYLAVPHKFFVQSRPLSLVFMKLLNLGQWAWAVCSYDLVIERSRSSIWIVNSLSVQIFRLLLMPAIKIGCGFFESRGRELALKVGAALSLNKPVRYRQKDSERVEAAITSSKMKISAIVYHTENCFQ